MENQLVLIVHDNKDVKALANKLKKDGFTILHHLDSIDDTIKLYGVGIDYTKRVLFGINSTTVMYYSKSKRSIEEFL